ncbi:hypothetical protein BVC80_7951g5 [Macleaya cordata]|uniref:Reverse transcriptase zinc-binding domain n=1 Tax=Macleaya cordata TaxID=56857 RepID=A0A200Q5E0_MACCD|nr:hypothetical protein BVC80_7951g5 [Macleaya cordata]
MAQLTRIGWRLMKHPTTLWAKILKAKYFPNTNPLDPHIKKIGSWIWGCIRKGLDNVKKYHIWEVGNGSMINV